jgi:tripartite-type tricarboxylate transporter receptor subunit TctC
MLKNSMPSLSALFVFFIGIASCSIAFSETYPNKPVQVVTPFPPGGAADVVVRAITQKLTEELKQSFVVDNKPGAGGAIGAQFVAHATPNGYTLLLTSSSTMSINPHLSSKPAYDPFVNFSPIAFIGYSPNVLVISPLLPFNGIGDLLAGFKKKPGFYSYASNGSGTLSHLTGEMFKQMTGVELLHVPYKGSAPAVVDVSGGQVSMLFAAYPSVNPMVKSGNLKALGVTSLKRIKIAPDLPTLAESGLSGFESNQWWGLFGPAGLPPEIVNELNLAMNRALQSAEIKKRFSEEGIELGGGSPAALTAYMRSDSNRWAKVIKNGNIKSD